MFDNNKSYSQAQEHGETPHIEMPPIEPETQHISTDQNLTDMLRSPEMQSAKEETETVEFELGGHRAEKEVPVAKEPSQSWKDLRTAREKAERERDEAVRYAQYLLSQQQQQQTQQQSQAEEDLDVKINDDDFAEGKHLSKVQKQIKKQQQELEETKRQLYAMTAEARLRSQYPDFDKVVTNEHLEALRKQKPALAASLNANPDLFSAAEAAYDLIKQFGIYVEDNFVAEKAAAVKNVNKVKPLASISPQKADTPLSHANAFAQGLTPELQKQLLKEMNDARKAH